MVHRIGPTPLIIQPATADPLDGLRTLARMCFTDSSDLRARMRELALEEDLDALTATVTALSTSVGTLGQNVASSVVSGSAVSLTTSVTANVTSISVPAGIWDVYGTVHFSPAATTVVNLLLGSISETSATFDLNPGNFNIMFRDATGITPSDITGGGTIGPVRKTFGSTTTVYLVAFSQFSVDTNAAYGIIRAIRASV